jgi:hypothetical protein
LKAGIASKAFSFADNPDVFALELEAEVELEGTVVVALLEALDELPQAASNVAPATNIVTSGTLFLYPTLLISFIQ